jgi:hypothetical protein
VGASTWGLLQLTRTVATNTRTRESNERKRDISDGYSVIDIEEGGLSLKIVSIIRAFLPVLPPILPQPPGWNGEFHPSPTARWQSFNLS